MLDCQTILTQVPTCIFWKDLNSIFLGCNMNFAKAAGLNSPEEIIGKSDYDLIWADTHADYFIEGDQEVLGGFSKINALETQARENQKIVTIITNKIPLLDKQGQKIGVIGNFFDLEDVNYSKLSPEQPLRQFLSRRHRECLLGLVKGYTSSQIGEELGLSTRTIEFYLQNMKIKFGCKNKPELIKKALDFDFIKLMLFKK